MKTYTKANKLNTITILALLWLGSFGGQAQQLEWKYQNPLPTGEGLSDVHMVAGSQTGWTVGDKGTILKTTTAGSSWFIQNSGTLNELTNVKFHNTQIGWAVGSLGTILKTTNGGTSWVSQNSGTSNWLSSVHFSDAQNGCAVGQNGTILKTSNGGANWLSQNSGITQWLSSVHFPENQIGWAVGQSKILKTSDGGITWVSQTSLTPIQGLNSVYFVNAQTGYIGGDLGVFIKTTNGGINWAYLNYQGYEYITSVNFINSQIGWAIESIGDKIFKTTNGGVSWSWKMPIVGLALSSIKFTDAQNGIAVGLYGTILKTTNGGVNWISQTGGAGVNRGLNSIRFSDDQKGWAVGDEGTIVKTTNGGRIWQKLSKQTPNDLHSLSLIEDQNGWSVGKNGTIMKLYNGSVWLKQDNQFTFHLNSVNFTNIQNGYIVGDYGNILKTTNGGQMWQVQSSGTTKNLNSVQFIDNQSGWVVGYGGTILKTSNGGTSWQNQTSGTTRMLSTVQFIDAQIGWIVGDSGLILKTINGGQNWQIQNIETTPNRNLQSVNFINSQIGWAVGGSGIILKTSNGGTTWINNPSGIGNFISSVYFIDSLRGWIVGNSGVILTTITNNYIEPETPTSLITGNLFEKTSTNCNPSPIPISNRLVKALPGPYYGISNRLGKYSLRLPLAGTTTPYTLQALEFQLPTFQVDVTCPPNNQYDISLTTIPDTLSNKDFGFEITPCHHLNVQLASNRRRRCFKNTTSISYQNQGSLSAPDAYILVEFPKWVRPVSASRSYVAINDSVWRFNLDTVSAGEAGSFIITDSVLCGNVGILGLSQCTKATIYPAPNCPTGNWNGASLSGAGKCLGNGLVRVSLANTGTGDMLDSSSYRIYLDSILVFQKKVKLVQNDSVVLHVQANGKLVHAEASQVANHPTQYSVTLNVEGCGLLNQSISKGFVNKFPLAQSPNSKTHCLPIQGAYDPNDKTVVPLGFTKQNIIPPNTQLEYLVRFQNTGNDTAFTVYVIDTLDTNLNPESLELGAASHNYQLSMQTVKSGKTFLRWQFNNIQLPDSTTNKLKSNGFIQYRISPQTNLALGTKVRNHAEIYFDFNPPIITNQTLSTFGNVVYKNPALNGNVQIVTAFPGKLSPKQIGVNLYPNPVTEHSLTADFQTIGGLTLFNAQGQLVFEKQNIEGKHLLPIQLGSGFYMAQLRTEKGISVVKVVVE